MTTATDQIPAMPTVPPAYRPAIRQLSAKIEQVMCNQATVLQTRHQARYYRIESQPHVGQTLCLYCDMREHPNADVCALWHRFYDLVPDSNNITTLAVVAHPQPDGTIRYYLAVCHLRDDIEIVRVIHCADELPDQPITAYIIAELQCST